MRKETKPGTLYIKQLIAEKVPALKQHLISGPHNVKYTSKTIQNEVTAVNTELIRDFRKCLDKIPHFTLIADETTSNGREILSVCLSLLDSTVFLNHPSQRKFKF